MVKISLSGLPGADTVGFPGLVGIPGRMFQLKNSNQAFSAVGEPGDRGLDANNGYQGAPGLPGL
jgi:hypothetical protein